MDNLTNECPGAERLYACADGALDAHESDAITKHAADCPTCARALHEAGELRNIAYTLRTAKLNDRDAERIARTTDRQLAELEKLRTQQ